MSDYFAVATIKNKRSSYRSTIVYKIRASCLNVERDLIYGLPLLSLLNYLASEKIRNLDRSRFLLKFHRFERLSSSIRFRIIQYQKQSGNTSKADTALRDCSRWITHSDSGPHEQVNKHEVRGKRARDGKRPRKGRETAWNAGGKCPGVAGARARLCGSECAGYITGRLPSSFSLALIVVATTRSNLITTR